MLQSLKKQVIFANPMTLIPNMETITLSYEPGSDFAVALDELIRHSEGVCVVKRSDDAVGYDQLGEDLGTVVRERIRQLEAGEVNTIPNEQVFAEIRDRYGF